MIGILGPYSPFLVGGSGLSFGGGVKIASGGTLQGGAAAPWPPLCSRVLQWEKGEVIEQLLKVYLSLKFLLVLLLRGISCKMFQGEIVLHTYPSNFYDKNAEVLVY